MKRLFRGIVMTGLISVLVGIGCGRGATPAPASPAPKTTGTIVTKAAWEEEWEKTQSLAQKEGKVSVMSTTPPLPGVTGSFKEKYGIDLEYFVGMPSEVMAKAFAERRAGIYDRDIIMGGFTPVMDTLRPELEPMEPAFILPEVKNVNVWRDKRLPFYDKEGKFFLFLSRVPPTVLVNKEVVKPEEINSWRNLLEPKWKGKILLFDPSTASVGTGLLTAVRELVGMDFLYELAKQGPVINRDKRLQVEWVARGKYPVAIGFEFSLMEEVRADGAPLVNVVPSEGTFFGSGVGGMAMFNGPAHPNAAKVFLNWFLSKEGQTLFAKNAKEQSRRIDVEPELSPDRLFREEIKYIDYDTEYFTEKMKEMLSLSKEIFAASYK